MGKKKGIFNDGFTPTIACILNAWPTFVN